jgi:hypothetical protein
MLLYETLPTRLKNLPSFSHPVTGGFSKKSKKIGTFNAKPPIYTHP